MNTLNTPMSWPRQAEDWLDAYGRAGWIVAMILGFVVFWPIGLALLAYMIWGKRMFGTSCHQKVTAGRIATQSTGNTAFDAYKADTLRRLEDEQAAFDEFLARLRDAKDKAEFDAFMNENLKRKTEDRPQGDTPDRAESRTD